MKLALVILIAGLLAHSQGVEGYNALLESSLYRAEISFPSFSLYSKFSDGSIYRDQHLEFVLQAVQEGVYNGSVSRSAFDIVQEVNSTTLNRYATYSQWEDTVALSGGSVLANRRTLHTESFLPGGINVSMNFEIYNTSGSMMWGPRPVNISSEGFKYSAFVSGWSFIDPSNRIRILVSVRYVTGEFNSQIPEVTLIDWNGPGRKVSAHWPTTGPLTVSVENDGWCLGDGIPGDMAVLPNPIIDPGFLIINNTASPKYAETNFGWIAPHFTTSLAWDPTLLMALFSSSTESPKPKDNFSRNAGIIAGSIVGGVVLATAAVAAVWYKRFRATRTVPRPSALSSNS